VVCHADEALLQARLAARQTDRFTRSDARLELWPALRAAFVEPRELHDALIVDTSQPLDACVDLVVATVSASASGMLSRRITG
jgi:hypothetical protein